MCTNCNQTSNTPCGCNGVYQEVNICNQCPPEIPCTCPIKDLSTDCVLYNQDDIVCGATVVVPKNTILSVALQQIVFWACTKFEELKNFFRIINIGVGAEIYAGDNLLGEKKLRKINSSSPLITVVQNTNDISIGVDVNGLSALQKTYSVANIGTGEDVYKAPNTVVGNNTQFNLKRISSNSLNVTTSLDGNTILIDLNDFNYLKSYYINFNYTPTINSPADGSIIRPFPTWDEARTKMIGNGTILNPENTNVTFILQTNATTALNPTINTLSVKFLNTKLTYTGSDIYMFDSEVLYPLVPKDGLNEITKSISLNLYGTGTLDRTTPGGYIRAIGAKRGLSTTTSNPNYIKFQIGENIDDMLTCVEYTNYSNSVWEGDVLNPDGITLLGNNYNPPLSLKWTTQINPTHPLIYIKDNSFASFSYPVKGVGSVYIQTFVNSGLHVENTNLALNNLTILPLSNYISVVQGNTFVADYPGLGIYEPKNAPAIYAKNTKLYINSILNVNTGTFAFHGYDKFFKIEGTFQLIGTVNYDTYFYIKTFADLTSTTQNYFELNGKTITANLDSRINYLINSSINGDFNLIMPSTKLTGVKNISQNNNTNVIPITNGTLSSINNNPYLSGINNYVDDAGASVAGLLKNALYFNTTNNALDKI